MPEDYEYYDGYVVDGAEDAPVMLLGNHGPQSPSDDDDDYKPVNPPMLMGSYPMASSDDDESNEPVNPPMLLGSYPMSSRNKGD